MLFLSKFTSFIFILLFNRSSHPINSLISTFKLQNYLKEIGEPKECWKRFVRESLCVSVAFIFAIGIKQHGRRGWTWLLSSCNLIENKKHHEQRFARTCPECVDVPNICLGYEYVHVQQRAYRQHLKWNIPVSKVKKDLPALLVRDVLVRQAPDIKMKLLIIRTSPHRLDPEWSSACSLVLIVTPITTSSHNFQQEMQHS